MPLIAVSAIVPSLLLLWFFHSRDVYPEPAPVIWATFSLGVTTVVPVLVVDAAIVRWLGHPASPYADGFGQGFLVAAIPEEFFKFLVVVLYCSRHREFDEPMDGIVYGSVASLGFATLENILYVSEHGIGIAFVRAVSAVPGHAFMGALMGYFVGQAKFNPARGASLLVRGYLTAMVLHGLYDAGLFTINSMTERAPHHELQGQTAAAAGGLLVMTLAVLVFEGVWALRLMQRLRREQFELARATTVRLPMSAIMAQSAWSASMASAEPVEPSAAALVMRRRTCRCRSPRGIFTILGALLGERRRTDLARSRCSAGLARRANERRWLNRRRWSRDRGHSASGRRRVVCSRAPKDEAADACAGKRVDAPHCGVRHASTSVATRVRWGA